MKGWNKANRYAVKGWNKANRYAVKGWNKANRYAGKGWNKANYLIVYFINTPAVICVDDSGNTHIVLYIIKVGSPSTE